jgi:hypothetical protein
MRSILVILPFLVLLGGCERSFVSLGNTGRSANTDRAYAARDTCLEKNVTADLTDSADNQTVAHTVAVACSTETEKLVAILNSGGDAKVADAVRKNSEARAMKYVLQARGQASYQ